MDDVTLQKLMNLLRSYRVVEFPLQIFDKAVERDWLSISETFRNPTRPTGRARLSPAAAPAVPPVITRFRTRTTRTRTRTGIPARSCADDDDDAR